MKKVIFIDSPKEEEKKPVEFTHVLDERSGWNNPTLGTGDFNRIVYLGKCPIDGDMFAAYFGTGAIHIFKGHLNSGEY